MRMIVRGISPPLLVSLTRFTHEDVKKAKGDRKEIDSLFTHISEMYLSALKPIIYAVQHDAELQNTEHPEEISQKSSTSGGDWRPTSRQAALSLLSGVLSHLASFFKDYEKKRTKKTKLVSVQNEKEEEKGEEEEEEGTGRAEEDMKRLDATATVM